MTIEDKLYNFLKYYHNSPQLIRNMVGFFYGNLPLSFRYGKTYKYYYKLLKESQFWEDNEKELYIIQQIKTTLLNAYESTSYYRDLFKKINFNPHKFNCLRQLEEIPFTDKIILRHHKNEILNRSIPGSKLLYVTTGGTSGIPIEVFYIKGVERSREFVFITNQWERVGYQYKKNRVARLRGNVVDTKGNNTLFKYEPIKNRLLLSTYDLYGDNIHLFINMLMKFKPDFIHTYPSAIVVLAKYLLKNNIHLPGIKGIFCSSEQFYPGQRDLIEKAFNQRVFSWYGHTEGATLAGECEVSSNYHIYFEYGCTELIDERGEVIKEPGKRGEIVGTSFEMKAFPIIRYRTGDFAEYVDGKCKCGRNYSLITNVKGRWLQENIITFKNSTISLTALNMHSDIFDNVVQYQFHQKVKGRVNLKIVRSDNYSEIDERKILKSFQEKLKTLVIIEIEYVNRIERTGRGKHKFLIQELEEEIF